MQEPCAAGPSKLISETHHAGGFATYLDVLQSKVLRCRAAMRTKLGLGPSHEREQVAHGRYQCVHVQVRVVAMLRLVSRPRAEDTAYNTHLPMACASSFARCLVSTLEFSVPM